METVSPMQPGTAVTPAMIFDFDGVFIDTERLKTLSYFEALSDPAGLYAMKITIPADQYLAEHPVGQGRKEVCEWALRRFDLTAEAEMRANAIESACRHTVGTDGDAYMQSAISNAGYRCSRSGIPARPGQPGMADLLQPSCNINGDLYSDLYRTIRDQYEPKGQWSAWKSIALDRGLHYARMKDQAPAIPEAIEFLHAARQSGFLLGLVTRTDRPATLEHLDRIQLGADVFNAMVCEGDPEVVGLGKDRFYREACTKLGISPEHAIAVEDTDSGVTAARLAGMGFIVAVPTDLTRKQDFLAAGADMIVPYLSVWHSAVLYESLLRLRSRGAVKRVMKRMKAGKRKQ